jgi:hypothetical protein
VPGQTAYVFTAVGTSAPAAEQKLPLNVTWVNLTTADTSGADVISLGDSVILRAWCESPHAARIGFGEAQGRILPAVG